MKEIWKPILGFEDQYEASILGNIRNAKTKKILKPYKSHNGYLQVILYGNDTRSIKLVHRLVWEAFNGAIPTGLQVNHINEIKTDNALINLNLMTPKENVNFGTGIKRAHDTLSKITLQLDKEGNVIKEWPSANEAIRYYGPGVRNCLHDSYHKSAYGYTWKYKEVE